MKYETLSLVKETDMSHTDYKVLPFETKEGHVPGFEIRSYFQESYQKSPIKSVVFETFDTNLQLSIEIVVHWTRWVTYTKRAWPSGGRVVAVILDNDTRWHAEALYARHYDNDAYLAAPIVCRDAFKIVTLGKGATLLEVVGVSEYLRNRTPLVDPWKRDNDAYHAQVAAQQAQAAI